MDHGWTADGGRRPLIPLQTPPVLPRAHAELVCVQLAIIPSPSLSASPRRNDLPPNQQPPPPSPPPHLPCLPRPPPPSPAFPPRMLPSFLPSPFRVPIALPPKIERRRRRRNSQLIAELAAGERGRVHQAHCTSHVEYRRAAARRIAVAASVVAEIHLLIIWLMSERAGMRHELG